MSAGRSGARTVLGVLLADARRHALQTATTLLGVAVGVAVVVAIHLSSEAAQASFTNTYGTLAGAATHQLTAVEPIPAARLGELLAAETVRAAQPVVETTVIVAEPLDDGPRVIRVLGLDPFLSPPFLGAWTNITPDDAAPGDDSSRATERAAALFERVLIEPRLALLPAPDLLRLGLPPGGGELRVRGPRSETQLRCEPLPGDWEGGGMPVALMDIASAQEVLELGDGVLRFDLVLEGPGDDDELVAAVPLQPGEVLERPARRGERAGTLTRAFRANLLALGFLAVLVGSFLAFNMAQFAVTRRRTLFGKLRCLGCSAQALLIAVLGEAAVVGAIGGVLGVIGGRLLANVMVVHVAGTVSTLYGYIETPVPELDGLTALGGIALAIGASVLASWAPARSAARTPPILVAGGVMREPVARARVPLLFAVLAGLLLLPPVGGLVLPALSVLCLLLAVATFIPLLLGWIVRRPPPGSTVLALALGRLRRSLARTGATAGALVMPIAMTLGIVIMVGSMQREIVNWVQATIGADVYIKPVMQELAPWTVRLDDELVDSLETWPGVERVDFLRGVEQRQGDRSFFVAGARITALEQRASLRILEGDPDTTMQRVRDGDVLISEPLHRKSGLGPGDQLTLQGRDGERQLTIAAVFQDFSFDRGYCLMNEPLFLSLYGDVPVRNAALLLEPGVSAGAVAEALSRRFPEAEFSTVDQLFERIMEAFDNTFRITYALQGISTTLALIGVLTGLLCLHLERRHELGVLRALGATRRTVGQLLLTEALVIVLLDAIVAIPVGLLLSWILIAVVNTRSFGWTFPMTIDLPTMGEVLLLAVTAALIAGIIPWLLVRRARIAQLLGSTAAVLVAVVGLGFPLGAQQTVATGVVRSATGAPSAGFPQLPVVAATHSTPIGPNPVQVAAGAVRDPTMAGQTIDERGFVRTGPGRPIVLPRDHGSHPDTRTEWWYLTGPLHAEDGSLFGFQATWFRRAVVARTAERSSPLATRDVMLFHGALTDVGAGRIRFTEQASRAYPPWARAAVDGLDVSLLGHRLVADDEDASRATLDFHAGDAQLSLQLRLDATEPLLHGAEPGYSIKGHEPGQASWYYSLPRIAVHGVLRRPDQPAVAVTGNAWMDHEFGSSMLARDQVGWDWFSVPLDDGTELMLFHLRLDDGSVDSTSSGTLRAPDGTRRHLAREDFELQVTQRWTSPHTDVSYPAGWVLRLPDESLELRITPVVADQELRTPGSTAVTYWEGLCRFSGTRDAGTARERPVEGLGYVELVGYSGAAISERF